MIMLWVISSFLEHELLHNEMTQFHVHAMLRHMSLSNSDRWTNSGKTIMALIVIRNVIVLCDVSYYINMCICIHVLVCLYILPQRIFVDFSLWRFPTNCEIWNGNFSVPRLKKWRWGIKNICLCQEIDQHTSICQWLPELSLVKEFM